MIVEITSCGAQAPSDLATCVDAVRGCLPCAAWLWAAVAATVYRL